LIETAAIGDLF